MCIQGLLGTSITWDVAKDDTGIAGYNIYANGELVGFATSNKYTLTGLEPGTAYKIKVEAVDLAGNKSPYNSALEFETAKQYPIGAPYFEGDLEAMINTDGTSVSLSWNEAKAKNQDVIGYRVYVNGQAIKPDGATFTPINSEMTTSDTSYTVTGLKQGKRYTFKVEAVGHATKYSKRERLSDVLPNGLVEVSGYRWSGFGPSVDVHLIPGKAKSKQAKSN